jgi:hypothetical protein
MRETQIELNFDFFFNYKNPTFALLTFSGKAPTELTQIISNLIFVSI